VTPVELGIRAFASLVLIGFFCGTGAAFVFRRTMDRNAAQRSIKRAQAYLLEFRLFMDEPRLILRAQRNLLVENARLLGLFFRPALILTLPAILIWAQLDSLYGHAALRAGEPALITIQFEEAPLSIPSLSLPAGISLDAPPVRVLRERQISWRIRPLHALSGNLRMQWRNRVLTKSISCGPGVHYLSGRREEFWSFPPHLSEPPLPDIGIRWIEVRYPPATILHLPWWAWFLVASAAAAL
jgi:hypothetical protein